MYSREGLNLGRSTGPQGFIEGAAVTNDLQKEIESLIQADLGWDHVKVRRWMLMPNPLLGGVTPDEMIAMGRGERLLKTVKSLLDENHQTTPKDSK